MVVKFIVVSYYTKDTRYERLLADNVLKSLIKFDLFYEIVPCQNQGNWWKNVKLMPGVIKNALEKYSDYDFTHVLYLDADVKIHQPITFPNEDIDFGGVVKNHNPKKFPRGELLSGMALFKINDRILRLVDRWNEDLKEKKERPFNSLHNVINKNEINFIRLPFKYCKQPDMKGVEDPMIENFKASRYEK